MPEFVSVSQQTIRNNDKVRWDHSSPPIAVRDKSYGGVVKRAHTLAIHDAQGNVVARIISSQNGLPVLSDGTKVAIVTEYPTSVID